MTKAAAVLAALCAAVLVSLGASAPAQAANTRVSISDFQWSVKNPQIDLGESVTWDWIGPDTQHSVSGQPDNATQWDSDPGSVGSHQLGDTFTVTFDQPGDYLFMCKLHTSVRGTVTVSDTPGDPDSDPGPQAPLNLDFLPPDLQGVYLSTPSIGPRGKGTGLNFSVSEKGTTAAEYFKLVKKGKRTVRVFQGYHEWSNHVGINKVKFGAKDANFAARPGNYEAQVTATDAASNISPSIPVQFRIGKKSKK